MNQKFVFMLLSSVTLTLIIQKTLAGVCEAEKEKNWSYEPTFPNGPLHWGDKYPGCNGKSQSPINIVTSQLTKSNKRQKLSLQGYDVPISKVKIVNDGHKINVTPKDNVKRSMKLDGDIYTLDSFHFHWGNSTNKGSEHEINGEKYIMETHFVHMNSKNQIAVIGVFFGEDNKPNPAFDNILFVKDAYMYKGGMYEGTIKKSNSNPRRRGEIHLDDILDEKCLYYRYNGSLTTPPCSEPVLWLVCRKNEYIEESQMKEFFSLYSVKKGTANKKECHLTNNYREVQPLNGRKVYR